ncbi:MAG: hypothetical protein IPK39_17360 [Sulfuritalea sp.]|nr:hypothetical protein [Sulfuritalea sp.]
MKAILLTLIALGLVGCGGVPVTRDDASKAQFASKPTDEESIRKIRGYLESVLIDPDSLKLKCSKVTEKAWAREDVFERPKFGYLVICDVNSKNRMGGYVGGKEFAFLFNGSSFHAFDYSHFTYGGSGTRYDLVR